MIEVVLAMGIIAVGMTSIMGLFPVGINASRDAVGYNTSVEMASNLISYMRAFADRSPNNFDDMFIGSTSLSEMGALASDKAYGIDIDGPLPNPPYSMGDINGMSWYFTQELKLDNTGDVALNASSNFVKRATGIYQKKETTVTQNGRKVYFLVKGPVDSSGNLLSWKYDFAAMAIVWKSSVTSKVPGTTNDNSDSSYGNSAGLNIELSWPLALNYKEREKQYFYVELKKPEFNLQD